MRVYRERLVVPASWWLPVTACAALLGTTLWAGLSIRTALVIYAALEGACAVTLIAWGSAQVTVTDRELRAGSQRLPLSQVAEVAALDKAQTRALRGPRADPAAYLLVRPYRPCAVYVEIDGRPPERPYWLVATRKPARLAEAIEQARSAARVPDHADEYRVARQAPGTVG
jgi:Protein of unknown function (DUF3093)